jgi:endonuclease-8
VPEGHTLRRLADDLTAAFAGRTLEVTSPQGRFAADAALLDGQRCLGADSAGKHLFVEFEGERFVHVHLGLIGGFAVHQRVAEVPAPVGAVRLRLVTADDDGPTSYADLRGATACELITREEEGLLLDRLGPDPLREDADWTAAWARVHRSRSPIATLLMDQSVLAGVGNVYRAEVLFRHRLDPMRPGSSLRRAGFAAVWDDLAMLLADGVRRGRIDTVRVPHPEARRDRVAAARPGRSRVWVYRRQGEDCFVCGTTVRTQVLAARNLFWCPRCQPRHRSRSSRVA